MFATALLSPAVGLMNRLSYTWKFGLLALIYLASMAVLFSSLYAKLNRDIQVAHQELEGLALVEPFARVTQLTQRHRGLSSALAAGDRSFLEQLKATAIEAQAAYAALEQKLPGDLAAAKRWRHIQASWEELRADGSALTADENFLAHTRLIDRLNTFNVRVADHFGLMLDPETGAFYLLDTLINHFPEVLENLGQLRALGTVSLVRKELSEAQKIKVLILTHNAREKLAFLAENLETPERFRPEVRDSLIAASQEITRQTGLLADYFESETLSRGYATLPANFFSRTTAVIDNAYLQMTQTLVPITRRMISERHERVERELAINVGVVLLLMLLVHYFLAGFYRSTMDSIRLVRNSAQKFAAGDMNQRITLNARDELSQVGDSFNEMADGFKTLLAARLEGEERTRGIVNSALDAMVQINSAGYITGWSRQAESCFGWSRDEALGRPLHETIIPPRYRDAHVHGVAKYAGSGHGPVLNTRIEIEALHRDGHEFPIELSIAPIKTAQGLEFSAFIRDVTARKQSEQALRQAMESAETANRAKSAFLANMSHEIRTPMNAIIALTHMLSRAAPTPEQAGWLAKINSAGKHLLAIISDVLDISKIEAGRLELEQVDFHLGTLLDNVYSMVAEPARAKGIALEVNPDSVPLWLHGDPTRLRQALINYAGNAIKFTDSGHVILRAKLLEGNEETVHLRFEVEDTGTGIPEEKIGSLFQAFEQADASITRKYGGTGLGLALTRRLAELMGGEAGAQSVPGQGSTFWFTVRLSRGRGSMPALAARMAGDAAGAESALRRHAGTRILLADDVAINREVAQLLLKDTGLVIDTAEDGRQAVEMTRYADYALILMDMQMPVMDGLEATRAIHALPGRAAIPVVAMTANAFDVDRRACREAGMVDFVAKPVDPEQLYATLLKWLPEPANPPQPTAPVTLSMVPGPPAADTADAAAPVSRNLPGVDLERGLGTWREAGTYGKFLQRFAADYAASAQAMTQALARNEPDTAAMLAHKMKGAAANLALTDVALHAGEVEQRLKAGAGNGAADALVRLQQALDTALDSIDRYAPLTPTVVAGPDSRAALDPARTGQIATLIRMLLQSLDADNPDRAEPLLHQLTELLPLPSLQALRSSLDDFDFRGAELAARDLAVSLEISLEA